MCKWNFRMGKMPLFDENPHWNELLHNVSINLYSCFEFNSVLFLSLGRLVCRDIRDTNQCGLCESLWQQRHVYTILLCWNVVKFRQGVFRRFENQTWICRKFFLVGGLQGIGDEYMVAIQCHLISSSPGRIVTAISGIRTQCCHSGKHRTPAWMPQVIPYNHILPHGYTAPTLDISLCLFSPPSRRHTIE